MRYLRLVLAFLALAGGFLLTGKLAAWLVRPAETLSAPAYQYRLAAIIPTSEEGYWRELRLGMNEAAKRYGVGLEFLGPRYPNDEHAIDCFHAAIAAGVDGIICQVGESRASSLAVARAVRTGITVITVGSDVPGSGRQGYVGPDPFYLGFEIGRTLRLIRSKARVAVLLDGSSVRSDAAQLSYLDGLRKALAYAPGLHLARVVHTPPGVLGAQSEIRRILAEDPRIDAICCLNPQDTLGVGRILRENNGGKRVVLIGTGILPETLHLLEDRTIAATAASYPFEMGFDAVRLFCDIRTGRSSPHNISQGAQVFLPEDAPMLLKQLARH